MLLVHAVTDIPGAQCYECARFVRTCCVNTHVHALLSTLLNEFSD